MSQRQKRLALAAVLAGLFTLGSGLAVYHGQAGAAPAAAPPTAATVDVAEVASRAVTEWQQYSGRLEAVDRRRQLTVALEVGEQRERRRHVDADAHPPAFLPDVPDGLVPAAFRRPRGTRGRAPVAVSSSSSSASVMQAPRTSTSGRRSRSAVMP